MRTLCLTLSFAACLVGVFTLAQATTSVGVVLSFMLFLMCMLLVSGSNSAISKALDAVSGWSVTGLTEVPRPKTRESVRRRPSKP